MEETQKWKMHKYLIAKYGTSDYNDFKYMGGLPHTTKYDKASQKMENHKEINKLIKEKNIPLENDIIFTNVYNTKITKTIKFNVHYKYFLMLCQEYDNLSDILENQGIFDFDSNNYLNCICGQIIQQRCFIMHKNNIQKGIIIGELEILGNCCIRRFFPFKELRECKYCKKRHNNTKKNLCSDCNNAQKKKLKKQELNNNSILKSKKKCFCKKNLCLISKSFCIICENKNKIKEIHNKYLEIFYNFINDKYIINFGKKYLNISIKKALKDKNFIDWACKNYDKDNYITNLNNIKSINHLIKLILEIKKAINCLYKFKYKNALSDDILFYC